MDGVFYYWLIDQNTKAQSDWERTRQQTYILFNGVRDKKSSVPWQIFKKNIFPLTTDDDRSGKIISEKQIAGTMNADQWQKWLKGEKPVDLEIIDS